jgi:hypothetical protein
VVVVTEASTPSDEPWPWHPDVQEPVCPIRGNPAFPSPGGEGVGGGVSLVQYKGITVTVPKQPSDIAKEALKNIKETDPYFLVCTEFVEYLDQCEQKGFILRGYDTKPGKFKIVKLDYNNRWGAARRKDLSEKLKRLEYWFELQADRPVTMVTLTSYQAGKSIQGAWHELNKNRDKLRKLIAKYFNNPDYFWVVEPHKSGYVHYHIAVFAYVDNETKDKKGVGIEDKFREIWSEKYKAGSHTYGLDFSKKDNEEDKIKHLKDYLSKYLEKGFLLNKWTPGMLKFNACLWETGFRMYGASKNIREIMNIKQEKPSQVVWLETKLELPEKLENGDLLNVDKVIWYRQYIPDWLDSDFWIWQGALRTEDPPPQYIYDWGRKTSNKVEFKVISMVGYTKRKQEIDPYEQYNKEWVEKYRK